MSYFVNFRNLLLAASFISGVVLLTQLGFAEGQKAFDPKAVKKDDFDRLDGHGKSGKRVDVIEFAGNLEIHVYPGGSTLGLGILIDRRKKQKPVAVIAYRFDTNPNQPLIRRAILSVPLSDQFKIYRDRSITEYDKFVITNHQLDGQLTPVKPDRLPNHLYPEGHPYRFQPEQDPRNQPDKPSSPTSTQSQASVPSHRGDHQTPESPQQPSENRFSVPQGQSLPQNSLPHQKNDQEDGKIQHFSW